MSTQEAASLATIEPNPVIDGRKANVNLAYLGAKPRAMPSAAGMYRCVSVKRGINTRIEAMNIQQEMNSFYLRLHILDCNCRSLIIIIHL
jgi:hypothetical protein